jgi:hypothetical protein
VLDLDFDVGHVLLAAGAEPGGIDCGSTSLVPYSVNVALTSWSHLKEHTRPEGVTSVSYKDWDKQRYVDRRACKILLT